MAGVGGCVCVYARAERAPENGLKTVGILWISWRELSTEFPTVARWVPAAGLLLRLLLDVPLRGA